ncbi:Sulfurtransferase FdhD [Fundidesulfovibrio magnetotacticus]|uniref:Sulfurtransferase FdhD n=1 Tax=Fundidesulfovibrio magnetotacticus TaxID=2730080 RepID=A0A6V8LU05_9BACT|nr:formate dehydrogenase accessory sulfurtransferase FdhD [Fundidesulfovibrio magnetotacticus]GFK93127.1 Sulfurtransferase FdhD [Fundidesulfovibrio magnetotacticus]
MDVHKQCEAISYSAEGLRPVAVNAVLETSLLLLVNGRELATLQCTGLYPRYLAAGFLFCNGIVGQARDIGDIAVDEREDGLVARIELVSKAPVAPRLSLTSGQGLAALGCGPEGAAAKRNAPVCTPGQLLTLAAELEARSELYRATRGCHNSTLCSAGEILFFCPDIGRHNAIDTIAGKCLLEGIDTRDKILLSTGRVSGEIALKAARCGFAVLASRSMATSLGAELARKLGLTLVGDITPEGCLIYHNSGSVGLTGTDRSPR